MKKLIATITGENMAGGSWRRHFYLEHAPNGTYTLRTRYLDPAIDLRDGVDIFESFEFMVANAGYSLEDVDLADVAENIATLDAVIADQFQRCPELLEERYEAEAKAAATEREAILLPYREIIDRYVLKISDAPLRYPGGASYGNPRGWITRFIEDYVVANGRLPTGKHQIVVQNGGAHYSGGTKDFSDLK